MSDAHLEVPVLKSARLQLRRIVPEDAPSLHLAFGDAESMRFWDSPPTADVAETEVRLRRSQAIETTWHATWAILRASDNAFMGMVNYHAWQSWNHRLGLGWILIPNARRHGYMEEAVRVVLGHCFGVLDTHRVEAEIEPENKASIRLAERLGFQREGLLRDRMFVAGEPRSVLMYSLLRGLR